MSREIKLSPATAWRLWHLLSDSFTLPALTFLSVLSSWIPRSRLASSPTPLNLPSALSSLPLHVSAPLCAGIQGSPLAGRLSCDNPCCSPFISPLLAPFLPLCLPRVPLITILHHISCISFIAQPFLHAARTPLLRSPPTLPPCSSPFQFFYSAPAVNIWALVTSPVEARNNNLLCCFCTNSTTWLTTFRQSQIKGTLPFGNHMESRSEVPNGNEGDTKEPEDWNEEWMKWIMRYCTVPQGPALFLKDRFAGWTNATMTGRGPTDTISHENQEQCVEPSASVSPGSEPQW